MIRGGGRSGQEDAEREGIPLREITGSVGRLRDRKSLICLWRGVQTSFIINLNLTDLCFVSTGDHWLLSVINVVVS